jgi:hypothetical protein
MFSSIPRIDFLFFVSKIAQLALKGNESTASAVNIYYLFTYGFDKIITKYSLILSFR